MFGQAKKIVVVLAVSAVFAALSFAFGGFTPGSSDAGPIDRTLKLPAQEDAVVTSANPSLGQPSGTELVVANEDGKSTISYLKFVVPSSATEQSKIVGTKLLLTPQQAVSARVQLHAVSSSSWDERSLTFNTAPPVAGAVGQIGQGPAATRWVDVSDIVTTPGTYTFALTTDKGRAAFASSETSTPPLMLVRLKKQSAPSPEPSTPGGSESPNPTPTQTSPNPNPEPTPGPGGCAETFPGDPCNGTMYYGASVEGGDPRPLESQIGRGLTVFRSYMQSSSPVSRFTSRASADVAAGRLPLISTKTPGSWADVASGRQDAWLTERIKALATVDGPVWLALHHEPRSDGDPADWVRMQQHARTLIDKYSDNIALVGILNGYDFLQKGGDPDRWRMPVGTGVHVMGYDNYNHYTASNGKDWKPVAEVMSPGIEIQKWGYPTLIGETGVHHDSSNPGRAADWIRDQYAYGVAHGFVAISYFNSTANSVDGGWTLTGERLTAFKENLGQKSLARIVG